MADGASRRPSHCLPVELCQVGAGGPEARQDSGGEKQVEAEIARVGAEQNSRAIRDSRSGSGDPRAPFRVHRILCRARAASRRNRAATVGERLIGKVLDPPRSRVSSRNLAPASGIVPLLSHLLRVRARGDRAARGSARRLAGPPQDRPLSPFPGRRIRSGSVITLQL